MHLVLYLVRVIGWLGCFSGGCAPQNFKENLFLLYMYISMHMSCCCFICNFLEFVCSQKANFYVIDNKDSVFYSVSVSPENDSSQTIKAVIIIRLGSVTASGMIMHQV